MLPLFFLLCFTLIIHDQKKSVDVFWKCSGFLTINRTYQFITTIFYVLDRYGTFVWFSPQTPMFTINERSNKRNFNFIE